MKAKVAVFVLVIFAFVVGRWAGQASSRQMVIILVAMILSFGCGFGLGFIIGRWKRDSQGSVVINPTLSIGEQK